MLAGGRNAQVGPPVATPHFQPEGHFVAFRDEVFQRQPAIGEGGVEVPEVRVQRLAAGAAPAHGIMLDHRRGKISINGLFVAPDINVGEDRLGYCSWVGRCHCLVPPLPTHPH